MRNKVTLGASDYARNSKLSCNTESDGMPMKLAASSNAAEKADMRLWFFCLIGISLLSLITRLHYLHQPASVWLVTFEFAFVHCFCIKVLIIQ